MSLDCIFCKIIKGKLPCYKVYEDSKFLAFLDVNPLNPGHTLLVPKKHVQFVDEYEPFCDYWKTARKLSKVIKKSMRCILVSYVVYGLGVPHAHIHLIPKFKNDEHPLGPDPHKVQKIPKEEMRKIASRIKNSL
ncbi:MAG: HIT family protein [Candidatus Pacearchaeota archaeon]